MKLKDHVEGCCLIINQAAQGPFLFDEVTENFVEKNKIEHFVIVHAQHNHDELNEGLIEKKKKKRKKEPVLDDGTSMKDAFAQQSALEDEDDDELGKDEERAHISGDTELRIIASSRKINIPSLKILADEGWFLCPVYQGMTELRPMNVQILERKKGYRSIITSKVLWKFPEGTFTKENLKDWEVNSLFIINAAFDKGNNINGLHAESIFLHKKVDTNKSNLKYAINRLETTQKTRIKLGNILVDEILLAVGQEKYIINKEKLALLKKEDKKKKADDLKEYDLKDVKIIEYIVKAYNKLNKKAEELEKKVPINRETTFNTILEKVKYDDEQEHIQEAQLYILEKIADSLGLKVEDLDPDSIPQKLEDFQRHSLWAEAYDATDILRTKDYIPTYITYIRTKIYMNSLANENDADTVVSDLAKDTVLWKFAEGVTGFGDTSCAYLEANIDWRAAIHPSSVIRYLGMDNVVDVPNRKDKKGNDILMEDKDIKRYIEMANFDLARKFALKSEKNIDEINHETFDFGLKTDTISNYGDFLIAYDFYRKEFGNLHIAEKEDKLNTLNMEYIAKNHPDYAQLLLRMWVSFDVVYTTVNGITVPAVKKRARHKGDWNISSYVDKNGKVKFKKSMGYNPKLKSRFIELLFKSMLRNGNEHYVGVEKKGIKGIYLKHKDRLRQRYANEGKNPDDIKMMIHMQARRFTMQILLEDIWKFMRLELGLPLNGGTFYEAKLHGSHGNGFDPAVIS